MKTRMNALMSLAMLAALQACGPDGGDGSPAVETPAPDAGSAAAADGAAPPTGAARFLGTWTYVSGSYTLQCPNEPASLIPVAGLGTVTFGASTTPDEIIAYNGMGCDIPCTVSGDFAECAQGTVCPIGVVKWLHYTLQDGMVHEEARATAALDGQDCDLTDDAMMARR